MADAIHSAPPARTKNAPQAAKAPKISEPGIAELVYALRLVAPFPRAARSRIHRGIKDAKVHSGRKALAVHRVPIVLAIDGSRLRRR